jgi:hypothetical protein
MLRVLTLLGLVLLAQAQATQTNTSSCLYTRTSSDHAERFQFFQLFNSGGYHAGSWSAPFLWLSPQSGIMSSSFILTSWSTMANYLPSFTASLSSISATGATFNLNIEANSVIGFIGFQVILLKSCSGRIQLQLFGKQ